MSFFFAQADSKVFAAIERRRKLAKGSNYNPNLRNGYCKITTKSGETIFDPAKGGVFATGADRSIGATYGTGTGKPKPSLLSLEVTVEGDAGSLRRATGKLVCHDLDSFYDLEKQCLLPKTEIKIKYGYSNPVDATDTSDELDFTVYDYAFTLDESNNIQVTFKAVGKGQEILEANSMGTTYYKFLSPGDFVPRFVADYNWTNEKRDVSSLADALDYLVQWEVGALNTSGFEPGKNTGWFHDKRSTISAGGHEQTGIDFCVMKAPSDYEPPNKQKVGVLTLDRITYYSLNFICWVINHYVTRDEDTNIICDGNVTKGRKGKFPYQSGGKGCPMISGDPIMVAFLNGTNWDNYADGGDSDDKDNLRFDLLDKRSQAVVTGGDLSRILVSRDCISSLMHRYRDVDGDDKDVSKVSVKRFLGDIFATIESASGGAYNLYLQQDPEDISGKRMLVINGKEPPDKAPKVVEFDPMPTDGHGDGVTKKITMTGKVPKAVQAAAFGSTPGSGDEPTSLKALDEDDLEKETEAKKDVFTRLEEAHNNLAYNDFDGESVSGLKAVLKEIVSGEDAEEKAKGQTIPYPLEMECTLHGLYGFKFGDTVSSKHLPRRYTKTSGLRVGFTVTKVTDKIVENMWTTELGTTCRIVNI